MNDLMQKLMVSKQIMDRHNDMDRGITPKKSNQQQLVREYDEAPIPSTYNIPEEYLSSSPQTPKASTAVITEDRIKNSKLPDSIKRLMMEHPIQQAQQYQATISDDIIEKAARLMGNRKETVVENKPQPQHQPSNSGIGLTANDIRKIVRETVEEVLTENGLMVESTQKSNEIMTIKVGKHVFEGKISKVKKLQ
jgi:hypothetical protein